MSENEIDKLIVERDPESLSDGERVRRMGERMRLMGVLLIGIRDSKDAKIAALEQRLHPLELQLIGWKAQLALLIAEFGLAIAIWTKSMH